MYHGTDRRSKASIRENGFTMAKKRGGFEALASQEDELLDPVRTEESSQHHYFSKRREDAEEYAREAGANAALVRVLIPSRERLGLEQDPAYFADFEDEESGDGLDGIVRTKPDVPKRHVIGAKKSAAHEDGAVFQDILTQNGVTATQTEAGALLREVQSDSDKDFA